MDRNLGSEIAEARGSDQAKAFHEVEIADSYRVKHRLTERRCKKRIFRFFDLIFSVECRT